MLCVQITLAGFNFSSKRGPCVKIDWTIIIPVLDEAGSLERLLDRLYDLPLAARAEVLVVDGGSTDHTRDVFLECARAYPRLYLIEAPRGKGLAISLALSRAKGRFIAYMDGDLQYLPEDLPKLARRLEGGADLVVSRRKLVWNGNLARRIASRIFADGVAGHVLHLGVSDPQSGMKALRASLLPRLRLTERHWGLDVQLIRQAQEAGVRIAEVDISFVPREKGQTKTGFVSTSLDLLRTSFGVGGVQDKTKTASKHLVSPRRRV